MLKNRKKTCKSIFLKENKLEHIFGNIKKQKRLIILRIYSNILLHDDLATYSNEGSLNIKYNS